MTKERMSLNLAHYRGPQRKPVFARTLPTPRKPETPFWVWALLAAAAGATITATANHLLQVLG